MKRQNNENLAANRTISLTINNFHFERFDVINGVFYAIDTKKYRYWFKSFCNIERFPIKQVCDKFSWEINDEQKQKWELETKYFSLKRFWRGFTKNKKS